MLRERYSSTGAGVASIKVESPGMVKGVEVCLYVLRAMKRRSYYVTPKIQLVFLDISTSNMNYFQSLKRRFVKFL